MSNKATNTEQKQNGITKLICEERKVQKRMFVCVVCGLCVDNVLPFLSEETMEQSEEQRIKASSKIRSCCCCSQEFHVGRIVFLICNNYIIIMICNCFADFLLRFVFGGVSKGKHLKDLYEYNIGMFFKFKFCSVLKNVGFLSLLVILVKPIELLFFVWL